MKYLLLIITLFIFAGCSDHVAPGTHTFSCGDNNCEPWEICNYGVCTLKPGYCNNDNDCPSGICGDDHTCQPATCNCEGWEDCDDSGTCSPKQNRCNHNIDCASGVCDRDTHSCVECISEGDCAEFKTCSNNICVLKAGSCYTNENCSGDLKYCSEHSCVACLGDQHCESWEKCYNNSCTLRPTNCLKNSDCPENYLCGDDKECYFDCTTCGENSECNTDQTGCICNEGYRMVDGDCIDIDECAEDSHTCGEGAICENSAGSFSCSCRSGFHKEGELCVMDSKMVPCIPPVDLDNKEVVNEDVLIWWQEGSWGEPRGCYWACQEDTIKVEDRCLMECSSLNSPKVIDTLETITNGSKIVVSGEYGYVATLDQKIFVLNLNNPRKPEIISSATLPGLVDKIKIYNQYGYVLTSEELIILNLSDPYLPVISNSISLSGEEKDIVFNENYAYISNKTGLLKIINISNPEEIKIVNEIEVSEDDQIYKLEISKKMLFVGLQKKIVVMSLENSEYPEVKDTVDHLFPITLNPENFMVKDDYLFIVNGINLSIFKINDRGHAIKIQTGFFFGTISKSMIIEDMLYLWGGYSLSIYNATDLSSWKRLYSIRREFEQVDLAIQKRVLYLIEKDSNRSYFRTIDLDEGKLDASRGIDSEFIDEEVIQHITYSNKNAFIAKSNNRIDILSIDNPAKLELISSIDVGSYIDQIVVRDHYLYILKKEEKFDQKGELVIYDIQNSGNPLKINSFKLDNVKELWVVSNNYIYIRTNSFGMLVLYMDDPYHDIHISNVIKDYRFSRSQILSLEKNYIVSEFDLRIYFFDVSDPENPIIKSGNDFNLRYIDDGISFNNYLYLVGQKNIGSGRLLSVINYQDVKNPVIVNQYYFPKAKKLQITENYLWFDKGNYIEIYDLSNPEQPEQLLSLSNFSFDGDIQHIKIQDNYAFVFVKDHRIVSFDLFSCHEFQE